MNVRKPAKPREFKVNVKFDSNRLESEQLSSTYELVLPTISEKAGKSVTKPRITRINENQLNLFDSPAIVNS